MPHYILRHWELININPEDLQIRKKKKTWAEILKSLIILGEFCVEAQAERLHADRTLKRRQAGR